MTIENSPGIHAASALQFAQVATPIASFCCKGWIWAAAGDSQRTTPRHRASSGAQSIKRHDARLVVIDPIQSYLGAHVDAHRANETRPIMDSLVRLAESTGAAIL